jgi:hypothetical protein
MKRKTIITNNKEIYEKFNMLNFSTEVVLKDVKPIQIERIIGNINKSNDTLRLEKIGDYFLVKKIGHINFNIYLR